MKKNKLYIAICIILLICLLSISAVCNRCNKEEGLQAGEETTAGPAEAELSVSEDTEAETTSATTAAVSETTATGTSATTSTETETTAASGAPTIRLEVYMGPTHSASDDVCYYRVRAIVTGSPTPAIAFSRDDSSGAWGAGKAQVNLTRTSPSYRLTATATNSKGSSSAYTDLTWGCGGTTSTETTPFEIAPPESVVTGTIPAGTVIYDLLARANEAEWQSSSGLIFNDTSNDSLGFARWVYDVRLENGVTVSRVLETHPEWIDGGEILGFYPEITLPAGANLRFTAQVGFIDGAAASDGVGFFFCCYSGVPVMHVPVNAYFDGHLDTYTIDISIFAGATIIPSLRVSNVGGVSTTAVQDWAVWVNPRIESY